MNKKTAAIAIITLLTLSFTFACEGPEEKKMSFFEKGKALYEKGDYVKARLELKNAVQIDPNFAQGYYYLGLLEMKDRNYRQAFGFYSKAIELDPQLLDAQLEVGRLYLASRASDKALEKAELVLAADPENVTAAALKASVLMREKKDAEARQILNGLLDKGVTEPDVYLLLALDAVQQNDAAGAVSILEKGAAANPKSVAIYAFLARVHATNKNNSEAEAAMQKIIDIEPDNAAHRFSMANLLWQANQRAKADKVIAEIITGDPGNEENRLNAARFYVSQKHVENAEKILQEGIKTVPTSFQLRFALAELYLQRNQPDEAEKTLNECLTIGK